MSSSHPPDSAADRGELLAAYLDGDLDELTVQRLEHRLRDDADLRAELDRIHDVVVTLRRVDAVEPPAGLSDRIRAHVRNEYPAAADATEVADAPGATAAAGQLDATGAPPVTTRARPPAAVPRWWQRPITVAAALGLLGVVGVSSLGVVGLGGGDDEAGGGGEMAAMSAESGAGAAAEGLDGATGDDTAAGADAPAQDDGGDAAEEAAAPVPEGFAPPAAEEVAIVEGLEDPEAREGYLREVRTQPEVAERLADPSAAGPTGRYAQLLADRGVPEACTDAIAPAGLDRVVRLLETSIDGAGAIGAVSVEDDELVLRIAGLEGCAVLVETSGPA